MPWLAGVCSVGALLSYGWLASSYPPTPRQSAARFRDMPLSRQEEAKDYLQLDKNSCIHNKLCSDIENTMG